MATITISNCETATDLSVHDLTVAFFRMTTGVARLVLMGHAGVAKQKAEGTVVFSRDASVDITDWLSGYSSDPEEVRRFCVAKNLMPHVKAAISLARKAFPVYDRLSLRVEQDPESDANWLVVDVTVKKGMVNVLDCYDRFIDEWIAVASSAAVSLIHLTFKLV